MNELADPVCGQPVATPLAHLSEEYAGSTYFFCSQACLDRFIQDADIFTLGGQMGSTATRDRGLRGPAESRTYPGPTTFEQSQT